MSVPDRRNGVDVLRTVIVRGDAGPYFFGEPDPGLLIGCTASRSLGALLDVFKVGSCTFAFWCEFDHRVPANDR